MFSIVLNNKTTNQEMITVQPIVRPWLHFKTPTTHPAVTMCLIHILTISFHLLIVCETETESDPDTSIKTVVVGC